MVNLCKAHSIFIVICLPNLGDTKFSTKEQVSGCPQLPPNVRCPPSSPVRLPNSLHLRGAWRVRTLCCIRWAAVKWGGFQMATCHHHFHTVPLCPLLCWPPKVNLILSSFRGSQSSLLKGEAELCVCMNIAAPMPRAPSVLILISCRKPTG